MLKIYSSNLLKKGDKIVYEYSDERAKEKKSDIIYIWFWLSFSTIMAKFRDNRYYHGTLLSLNLIIYNKL